MCLVGRSLPPKFAGPGTAASPTRSPNNPVFQDTNKHLRRFILKRQYLLFPIQLAARSRLLRESHLCSVQSFYRGSFIVRTGEITMLLRSSTSIKPSQSTSQREETLSMTKMHGEKGRHHEVRAWKHGSQAQHRFCSQVPQERDFLADRADPSATTAAPAFTVCRNVSSERPLVKYLPNHRLPPHSSSQ